MRSSPLRTAVHVATTNPCYLHIARGRAPPLSLSTGFEWNRVGEEYAYARRIYNERFINNPRRAMEARVANLPLALPLPALAPAASPPSTMPLVTEWR